MDEAINDMFPVIAIAIFYLMVQGALPVSLGWIMFGVAIAVVAAGFRVWEASQHG